MPDERILALRRELAAAINRSLGPGAQHTCAPSFGIPQPRMSELERGLVHRCSIEWLILRIYRLGGTVRFELEVPDARRAWWQARFKRRREERGGGREGT